MKYLLFIVSLLVGFVGMTLYAASKTSIHEIQAAVLLLMASVLFVGAAIVSSVNAVESRLNDLIARQPGGAPAPAGGKLGSYSVMD